LASNFLRNASGATLLEYTVVFPVFLLVVFGTLDVTLMLYEWSQASKAAYMGARLAVVSNPVAGGLTPNYAAIATQSGNLCFNAATGNASSAANCPSVNVTCIAGSGTSGSCTPNSHSFSNTAFAPILAEMQRVYPALTRQNVQITYESSGLGYVGRPTIPMNVTVSIRCRSHQFYFLGALMGWTFPPLPNSCPGPLATNGPRVPAFATTLPSEDLVTN
jgi:Flp pilus assembly protein TadG